MTESQPMLKGLEQRIVVSTIPRAPIVQGVVHTLALTAASPVAMDDEEIARRLSHILSNPDAEPPALLVDIAAG
jgi:hypothetical protein